MNIKTASLTNTGTLNSNNYTAKFNSSVLNHFTEE